MFIGLLIGRIKVFYERGVIMSKVNMSNLILFLCASSSSSKIPVIVFAHHTTAEGCTELCKLIKETYDNEEKNGSSHT
jgi:hypothetical protein